MFSSISHYLVKLAINSNMKLQHEIRHNELFLCCKKSEVHLSKGVRNMSIILIFEPLVENSLLCFRKWVYYCYRCKFGKNKRKKLSSTITVGRSFYFTKDLIF